jgi:hypothetical protein
MADCILFRALPGIAEIESQILLWNDNRLMKDEIEALERVIDAKSVELFGISEEDTSYWRLPSREESSSVEEWEEHFAFLDWEWEEEDRFWEVFGLDLHDENGDRLACIDLFGRQLVCALKRIHPKAVLTFGDAPMSLEQLQAAAEAWGRHLQGR